MNTRLRVLFPIALLVGWRTAASQDLQRGFKNYQDIIAGRKKLDQLSPQEQQEVLIVFKRVKATQSREGKSAGCRDARDRAESAASELSDRARKLRNCAENQDYTDECDTEFRRVRNAHSDYESAVSSVKSECN